MTQRALKPIGQRQAYSKRGSFPLYRTNKWWTELKLHAVCNASGQPVALHLTEGQASDYKGAAVWLNSMPEADELLADRGCDTAWFRKKLLEKGIAPRIPSRRNRKEPVPYDKELYKQRHKIEIIFGGLKDWRRISMSYDRCAHTFMPAIHLAAVVSFYLNYRPGHYFYSISTGNRLEFQAFFNRME